MEDNLYELIGERLMIYRQTKGIGKEEFAHVIGITPQFLNAVERGKKGLSAKTVYRICSHYDLSADQLIMGKDPEYKKLPEKTKYQQVMECPKAYRSEYATLMQAFDEFINKRG